VASPNAPLDLADLNPAFSPYLNRYTSALDKAGIGYRVDSGYRSPEQQAEIYARSNQGRSFPAAPPWRSFHNFGLAADVIPNNPADLARMHDLARQAGLYDARGGTAFNYDAPHVEMPGSLSNLISQYSLANWRPESHPAPSTGAIAYAGPTGQPSRPASSSARGTTLYSTPVDIILNAESGDQNINNVHQMTSSGQAQGNAQITTGTWTDFAPKAGIDLKMYPTPDSAPRSVQLQVMNTIPLNRWAKSTVDAVLAKYPGIDTSQTVGQIQSAALGGSGASTAVAGGNSASPAPGQPAPPQQALAGFQAGSPAEKSMLAAGKTLGLGGGGPGGGQGGGDDAPPMMRLPSAPPAMAAGGSMMMAPGGQNTMGQRTALQALAQQGFSTQPQLASAYATGVLAPVSSTAQSTVQPMASGAATGMPGLPGTTLNSPSQLQMALMSGAMNPYDLYASGGRAGGFGSS
jgi:hypothetical protein